MPIPYCPERRPTGALRDLLGVLATADRVGQEDVVRVGLDDELSRELWIAPARRRTFRCVRDALHPQESQHLPDERRRGLRVVRLVKLEVVGVRLAVRGCAGGDVRVLAFYSA